MKSNLAPSALAALFAVITLANGQNCSMANTGQDESKEHNRLGIALQARGRNVEAAQEYRKAIQVNSGCASCHNNLAVVLKELDKLEEAEREARLALRLKPGRADYLFNLGIIL